MRPVTVPNPPPVGTYDELGELTRVVDQINTGSLKRKRWQDVTKIDVVEFLNDLINDWVVAGCPTINKGGPEFADRYKQEDYEEYINQMGAGGGSWGDARKGLIQSLGAYCSYCTSPIFSHLHIEHVLPKSTFPSGSLAWTNFLLSCSSCNSSKGNNPSQRTVPGGPMSTANATNFIRNVGATNYLWPDFTWANIVLPSPFPYMHALHWVNFGRGGIINVGSAVDPQDASDLLARFKEGRLLNDRGLYFRPRGPRSIYKDFIGVLVMPDPGLSPTLATAVNRIIELASLNRIVRTAEASKTVDRRMLNRTTAWFRAHWVREQLTDAEALDGMAVDLFPAVIEQSAVTMKNTGFWGVWLQVLGADGLDGTTGQALLQQVFPGTSAPNWTV